MGNEGENQKVLKPKYDCLIFDMDDTLYPLSSGLSSKVAKNIEEYMIEKLGIHESKVPELSSKLYKFYGTTLAGLRAISFKIDYDDFHSFVHGRLPYEMLKPDLVLRNLLHAVPIHKIVFTNADKNHVSRVLSRLGLEDCFDEIICFETLNDTKKGNETADIDEIEVFDINEYISSPNTNIELPKTPIVCKPFEGAFELVFKNNLNINPQSTLFFDDSIRNLQSGKQLGLHTVRVGSAYRIEGVDHALESLHNMKEAFPELWEAIDKPENISCSGKIAIETPVKA